MKPLRWTHHALTELDRREIAKAEAEKAIADPDLVVEGNLPRQIFMRRYFDTVLQVEMLLRVVVEETDAEVVIVTLYKTSQWKKYLGG
ncbi:MAG: DUF4258 domain-containing protein [Thermoguttaceae bacterium]